MYKILLDWRIVFQAQRTGNVTLHLFMFVNTWCKHYRHREFQAKGQKGEQDI